MALHHAVRVIHMRRYEVSFEIEGRTAMFARPDTGSTPVSYPVPTFSALKGMFEAIARVHGAYLYPTRVEVCLPIRFERLVTNYGGPLRKRNQLVRDNNYQLIATVLVDVCYRVYGVAQNLDVVTQVRNPAHQLQEIFNRRLHNGQSYYSPCLGWQEFMPDYFGPLRDTTGPDASINLTIPSLLHSVFDQPARGLRQPRFVRSVEVVNGCYHFSRGTDAW